MNSDERDDDERAGCRPAIDSRRARGRRPVRGSPARLRDVHRLRRVGRLQLRRFPVRERFQHRPGPRPVRRQLRVHPARSPCARWPPDPSWHQPAVLAPARSRSTWNGPAAATAPEICCPCGTSCISPQTASPLPVAARCPRGRAGHSGRMALAATTGASSRPETTMSIWTNGATGSSSTRMPPEGSTTRGSGGSRSERP